MFIRIALLAVLPFSVDLAQVPQTRPPICDDFRLEPNGNWCPLVETKLGTTTLRPGICFGPRGLIIGRVDLAGMLNQQCGTSTNTGQRIF
jgi:hypothetical protein